MLAGKYGLVLLLSYIIGSIPFGLMLVRLTKGVDLREVHSGRTGGTNAMRAAGFWVGLATALLDILKGATPVWLAVVLVPGDNWLKIFAPLLAILGHNYSIFLISKKDGKLRLGGGAGGAPCLGGSIGLWAYSFFFIFPLAFAILFGIGYASVATMSIAIAQFFTIPHLFDFPGSSSCTAFWQSCCFCGRCGPIFAG
jgi:glycerol-3-phosphate acyltransferase PlsY